MIEEDYIHFNVCIKADCPHLRLMESVVKSVETEVTHSIGGFPTETVKIRMGLSDGSDYYITYSDSKADADIVSKANGLKIPKCTLGEGILGIVPKQCLYKLEHVVM